MHAWEAIQKTVDYIESHLEEVLETEQLAQLAALSPFYYQRLFTRLVKRPVKEYIRLRRLAKACGELKLSHHRILDIALSCGFSSHESLTKAFRAAYGMTPEQYRANPVLLNQFDKPDLLLHYVTVEEDVPLVSDGLVLEMKHLHLEEPIHFLGLTGLVPIVGQMPLGEGTGVDIPGQIWTQFHGCEHMLPRLPGGRSVGVAYLGDVPEGSFTYLAGAEVAQGAEADGFTPWQLPAGEYYVCGFEAEDFEQLVTVAINKAIKFTQRWLRERQVVQQAYSPELYYEDTPEAAYMELWVPVCRN